MSDCRGADPFGTVLTWHLADLCRSCAADLAAICKHSLPNNLARDSALVPGLLVLRDPAGFGFVTSSFCRVINKGNQARQLSLSPPIVGINPLKILFAVSPSPQRTTSIHSGPPVTSRNLERIICKTVFSGRQNFSSNFSRCNQVDTPPNSNDRCLLATRPSRTLFA